MKIIQLEEKIIKGISTRTNNSNEMNPETAKIASLYQAFDKNITVDYKSGARVYGVYYNYESDASGEFSVLAGADKIEASLTYLQSITIKKGSYLVFKGEGEMPQVVIDTWMQVWKYFLADNAKHQRCYATDFEYYKNETEVEIFIGIHV